MYKIYCLIDPFTMMPFYVGATKNSLVLRLQGHVSQSFILNYNLDYGSNLMYARGIIIKSIYSRGKEPIISLLCQIEKYEVDKMERFFYEKYTDEGIKLIQSKYGFNYQSIHDKQRRPRSEMLLNNNKEYKAKLKIEKQREKNKNHSRNQVC